MKKVKLISIGGSYYFAVPKFWVKSHGTNVKMVMDGMNIRIYPKSKSEIGMERDIISSSGRYIIALPIEWVESYDVDSVFFKYDKQGNILVIPISKMEDDTYDR